MSDDSKPNVVLPPVGVDGGGGGWGGHGTAPCQHSSHPAAVVLPSDVHVIVPDATTTPAGPLEPQYLAPSIVR
eukprot:6958729-Prymnesium_polylepis.1